MIIWLAVFKGFAAIAIACVGIGLYSVNATIEANNYYVSYCIYMYSDTGFLGANYNNATKCELVNSYNDIDVKISYENTS